MDLQGHKTMLLLYNSRYYAGIYLKGIMQITEHLVITCVVSVQISTGCILNASQNLYQRCAHGMC